MTAAAAFSVAVVCEAAADQITACDLAERVLLEEVDWLEAETIQTIVSWRGSHPNVKFIAWKSVIGEARRRGLRKHFGFRASPGAWDEGRARLALRLLALEDGADAVLLVRDTDNKNERIRSLEKARKSPAWRFEVILATPHPKRECWALAGFEPATSEEEETLRQVRQGLGFDPTRQPELLTAEGDKGKKNAKTVLKRLVDDDKVRENACWRDTDLSLLADRGRGSRLGHYLTELSDRLVPLIGGRTKPSAD